MSLSSFFTQNRLVIKFFKGSEYLIVRSGKIALTGVAKIGVGLDKLTGGCLEIFTIFLGPSTVIALVDDTRQISNQLSLKKSLSERFSCTLRPLIYALLSSLSLVLVCRSPVTKMTPWSETPMRVAGSRVHDFENYWPSLIRLVLQRRQLKIKSESLLCQHVSKLSDLDRLNHKDLFI